MLQFANRYHPGAARRIAKGLKLYRKLWRRSVKTMESVFGAGDAVLSESDHYLADWKTGFDLAFPIDWLASLAALTVICSFSVYLSPL